MNSWTTNTISGALRGHVEAERKPTMGMTILFSGTTNMWMM